MKVNIIEKKDNEVIVSFKGNSPMDAVLLGMVTMGASMDESVLQSASGAYSKGQLIFGSWSMSVIEEMKAREDTSK